jgi:hypothetical protein
MTCMTCHDLSKKTYVLKDGHVGFAGVVEVRLQKPDIYSVPVPVTPDFLPNLVYATGVYVRRFPPGSGQLPAVPGFKSLRQILDLTVLQTDFVNLTSFSGLQCPPARIAIVANEFLTSLTGLEGTAFPANFTTVTLYENPLLKPASAFAPLKNALGCKGSSGLASIFVLDVQVDGCPAMTELNALCSYVTSAPGTAFPS